MTATERLRQLLDKRGVEWDKGAFPNEARTYWQDTVARPWDTQRLFVHALLTPEQAVEATLGRGTCRRVLYKPTGVLVCSECGAGMPRQLDKYCYLHFCPNCGRRVES